jgi:hypothetical protein
MKTLMLLVIVGAGFVAQAAIIQSSNASCPHQKKGPIWEVTQQPEPTQHKEKPAPAPTQEASLKTKNQGA